MTGQPQWMRFRQPFAAVLAGMALVMALPVRAQQVASHAQTASLKSAQTEMQTEETRADILMARKMYGEAADVLRKIVERQPADARLLNKLGIAYYQQEKLGQAKKYYERAARADASYASPVNNIGTVHYQRRKYSNAVKFYRQAIALEPNIAAFHTNLGYAYFHQKKYEEAMQAFHQALRIDPLVFDRRGSAGTVLQHRGATDRALFNYFMAKAYARLGNAEKCAQYLKKARDEHYKGMAGAATDPAFSGVIHDPQVREALQLPPLTAGTPVPQT